MPRLACSLALTAAALAAAPLLGGCSSLLGIDDPVAAFPVTADFEGKFLVKIDDQPNGAYVEFQVEIYDVDVEARTLYSNWQALKAFDDPDDPRGPNGTAFEPHPWVLDNADTFDFYDDNFDIEFLGIIDNNVRFDAELFGEFPRVTDSGVTLTDAFCGHLAGAYLQPEGDSLDGATFGAVRVEQFPIDPNVTAYGSCLDVPAAP